VESLYFRFRAHPFRCGGAVCPYFQRLSAFRQPYLSGLALQGVQVSFTGRQTVSVLMQPLHSISRPRAATAFFCSLSFSNPMGRVPCGCAPFFFRRHIMSIAIPGKLTVIERNGSRGIFTVGELQTQIGAFQIKHRVLDQFPEGSYDGLFYLTRVYNQSNFAKGRIWVSLYADLDWEQLQIMAQNHVAEVSESLQMAGIAAEQEEETPPPVKPAAPAASAPADTAEPARTSHAPDTVPVQEEDDLADSMEKLEGMLSGKAAVIRLDPSMDDRNLFRQLREAVKQQGYRFHAPTQSWHKEHP
jgi:hypothetical protein